MTTVFCAGHVVQDFVFSVATMPDTAQKYRASDFQSVGGGPASTAAVAVSKLGHYGVDCSHVRRFASRRSSLSAVLVDEAGERLIVNYLDPSLESNADWLPQRLPDNVDAVLADTRWPEGAMHALRLARQSGIPAVLDADLPVPADGDLVRMATHVAFSADGLADYCGSDDMENALRSANESTDAWCCVTMGGDGVMWLADGGVRVIPAFDVEVTDTLGAGDVWHGAFALALGEDLPITDALNFAGATAALKVANGGGRAGTPSRRDVEEFLIQHDRDTRR
jgi:sulfofructose kinase